MHVAANPITHAAAVDYLKYYLRTVAGSEVDVVRPSESKDNIKGCPLGEEVSDDYDNLMIYGSEQVTESMPNACCSSDGTSDDRECGSRDGEMMNYDVWTTGRLGRCEEDNVGDAKSSTYARISITDETAVTTDQLREMTNEQEILTSNQKQKFTAGLMKNQANLTEAPGKCKGPFMISRVILPST